MASYLVTWTSILYVDDDVNPSEKGNAIAAATAALDSIMEDECHYFRVTNEETGESWMVDVSEQTVEVPEPPR